MTFSPKIIKPCRWQSKSPVLKKSRTKSNYTKGIETSLIFDLNILSKMHEVQIGKLSLKNSGLATLVDFLNKTPALCPTPGLAIQEVDSKVSEEIVAAFEGFLDTYCPDYSDHPNATRNHKDLVDKPKEFKKLPLIERYLNSIAYLGILKIQLVFRNSSELEPIDKFKKYINYMETKADLVGAVESEAAKYVFFDTSNIKNTRFKVFCKKIKENFKKGGATTEKLLERCLNSARDIMYYRICAHMSSELLDGKKQDTWLVTGDEGLYNLSESIHFLPGIENSDSKYVTFERHREQKESKYWLLCDDIFSSTVDTRRLRGLISGKEEDITEASYDKLLDYVSEAEEELSKLVILNS